MLCHCVLPLRLRTVIQAFVPLQLQSLMYMQFLAQYRQQQQVPTETAAAPGTITSAGAQRHACTFSLTLCCRRLTALTDCIDQYVQQQPAFMRLRPLEAVQRPHQPSSVLSAAKVTPPPTPSPPHLMSLWHCKLPDLVPCLALMLIRPLSEKGIIMHAPSQCKRLCSTDERVVCAAD